MLNTGEFFVSWALGYNSTRNAFSIRMVWGAVPHIVGILLSMRNI